MSLAARARLGQARGVQVLIFTVIEPRLILREPHATLRGGSKEGASWDSLHRGEGARVLRWSGLVEAKSSSE